MIVLGIDSSTDKLAVGLADDTRIIGESRLDSAQEHTSHIIGMIDSLLAKMAVPKGDLGGVAVADGPGSFTGLRIGMAVAKGMALALNIPIVGVSTFEVTSRRLQPEFDVFYLTAMVRKGEYYLCRVEPGVDVRRAIVLVDQEWLAAAVGSFPVGLLGRIPEGWPKMVSSIIPADKMAVSGGELAQFGVECLASGRTNDLADLEPLYIAPSQAERKFGRK